MPKCTITFLFDTRQLCQESWELTEGHAEPLPACLKRIAQARLPLLASSVRIVQLKAEGHSRERVFWRGTGGGFAFPRFALKLMDDMRHTHIFLRGVPREIFAHEALTAKGIGAFREFNRVLKDCGCVIVRGGESHPITKLEPWLQTLFGFKKDKKATRRQLVSMFGVEEGQRFWEESKTKPGAAAGV